MNMPSSFELGRAIGGNISGGIQQGAEMSAIDKILMKANESGNPRDIENVMGQILQRVAPERQQMAHQILQNKQAQLQSRIDKQRLYNSLGFGDVEPDQQQSAPNQQQSAQAISSPPREIDGGVSQPSVGVQGSQVPFARAKLAALEGNVPLARVLADEEKLNIKERNELRKEAEPKLLELEESLSGLKNQEMKFDRLGTLFSPELESKFPPRVLAAAFTKHGDLSALGQSLLSDEAQEAVKLITDEIKGAKDTFGARVSNFEAAKFLQTLPSLLNSPEGRRRVLRDLKFINNINQMEKQGILDVMDRFGGPGSISLSKATSIFRKEFEPKRKELAEEFANPDKKIFKEIPMASMYTGKRFVDEETGQVFKSDGKNWIPEGGQ